MTSVAAAAGGMQNASDQTLYTVWDIIDSSNATTSQAKIDGDIFSKYKYNLFMQQFCPLAANVDKVVTVIWYILGLSGNLVSAKIWLEKRMRINNSSAIYLAALSISDLLFLSLHTVYESEYAWGHNTLNHPVFCECYFMFYYLFQYFSPTLVLAFTCERWIAVCHPFDKEKYCTTKKAIRVIILLFLVCLSLASMQAYLYQYDPVSNECTLRPHTLDGPRSLWSVWTWTTEMLVFLLVPLVILLFNILVIREVRSLSRNGQRMMLPTQVVASAHTSDATTVMLLCVSFYVIITVLPATIVYAIHDQFPFGDVYLDEAAIAHDPTWQSYFRYATARKFIEEICISHYACNIFLYILTGPQFRRSLQRQIQRLVPNKLLKDDSFATLNSAGSHKTSIRNLYTAVHVNGTRSTTKV